LPLFLEKLLSIALLSIFLFKQFTLTTTAIREKLYDYIRVADDKKVKAIYMMLEDDITARDEWWKDVAMIEELETRYQKLASNEDKGKTIHELEASINRLRQKKYFANA
jgi:hypothetical protein